MRNFILFLLPIILTYTWQTAFCQNRPAPPIFTPYSPVSPNLNQKRNWNNLLPISPTNVFMSQRDQFQKVNQELLRQQQQAESIRSRDREDDVAYNRIAYLRVQQQYRQAFDQIMGMDGDNFSITKAVFLVENVFYDNCLSFAEYIKTIKAKTDLCKQIMKSENLNPDNDLAKNYAIQKLFSGRAKIFDKHTKSWQPVKPFRYDFEDFRAEKDWTRMFVVKLLNSGTGQCHSLPLLYKIIAEQLNTTAWLSTAPEHSYIKFPSGNGNIYNFETTQGKIVSDQAIVMSGYITPAAIKNKMYMDTLGRQQLIAQMLVDLLQGYKEKIRGYDLFAEEIADRILVINPNNIMALMMKADMTAFRFEYSANNIGRPPIGKLPEFPELFKLYNERNDLYDRIDNSGYQAMPAQAYQQWLQSLKEEKRKQESEKLREEIKRMVMSPNKPILINKKN